MPKTSHQSTPSRAADSLLREVERNEPKLWAELQLRELRSNQPHLGEPEDSVFVSDIHYEDDISVPLSDVQALACDVSGDAKLPSLSAGFSVVSGAIVVDNNDGDWEEERYWWPDGLVSWEWPLLRRRRRRNRRRAYGETDLGVGLGRCPELKDRGSAKVTARWRDSRGLQT